MPENGLLEERRVICAYVFTYYLTFLFVAEKKMRRRFVDYFTDRLVTLLLLGLN